MAVELEETVMQEIGLGAYYSWFNGSGSCQYIREAAVKKLPVVAQKHGLTISRTWLAACRQATQKDGHYRLTDTWIACSYAIQDAIYRSQGGNSPEGI